MKIIIGLFVILFAIPVHAFDFSPTPENCVYDPMDFAIQEDDSGVVSYPNNFKVQEQKDAIFWGLTDDEWWAEAGFQALNIFDFALTDRILDQGGYEMNFCLPIDGDSSDLEMGLVTVGIGVIHYMVTRYVIEPEWRPAWQWISSGAKAIAVGHNLTVVRW